MTNTAVPVCSPDDLPSPELLQQQFLQSMRMQNCTVRTVEQREFTLRRFITWLRERGMESLSEVTPDVLAAYRRYLFHYRHPRTAQPLAFATQASYLTAVRCWFAWLADQALLPENVARKLEIPKEHRRLPASVLTVEEVARLLNATAVTTALGLRDRALLEMFYSTAMRCSELLALQVYDIEAERGVVTIRHGKGNKDRLVPIGQRALSWLQKYTLDVRPELVAKTNATALFVSCNGRPFGRTNLSALVRGYFLRAGIRKAGSCHVLRHTAATLMLERGADLRSLQMYLGHERLNTTQIYTHVSIKRLQQVHQRTHPADMHDPQQAEQNTDADDRTTD